MALFQEAYSPHQHAGKRDRRVRVEQAAGMQRQAGPTISGGGGVRIVFRQEAKSAFIQVNDSYSSIRPADRGAPQSADPAGHSTLLGWAAWREPYASRVCWVAQAVVPWHSVGRLARPAPVSQPSGRPLLPNLTNPSLLVRWRSSCAACVAARLPAQKAVHRYATVRARV